MNYKYKLIENEEESGSKRLTLQNELILTPLGKYTVKKLIDIINDPKNLKGAHSIIDEKLKELETRIFGPPGRKISDKEYINLYNTTYGSDDPFSPTNGPNLYKTISQEVRGFQPGQKKEILDNGKRVAVFPIRTAENLDIVSEFFTKRIGKTAKEKDISKPVIVNDTLKFPISDEGNLIKILNNAKLISGEDYKLSKEKEKTNENLLRNTIKEIIIKNIKK